MVISWDLIEEKSIILIFTNQSICVLQKGWGLHLHHLSVDECGQGIELPNENKVANVIFLRWHNPGYFCENLDLYIFVLSFNWSDGDLNS